MPPAENDEIAIAKAKLIEAAAAVDPLALVREHPLICAAAAVTTGVMLGAGETTLKSAASLAQSLVRLTTSTAGVLDRLRASAEQREQSE